MTVGGQCLEHRMVHGSGEPDQGVRGGAPALDPERTVALFADPYLVTGLQAEPVPEVGRDNESSPVIKSGIPTAGYHMGRLALTHLWGQMGHLAARSEAELAGCRGAPRGAI